MKVYRLETADGLGPWSTARDDVPFGLIDGITSPCSMTHPTPWTDGLLGIAEDEHCCCQSLSDIRIWFFQNREQSNAVFNSAFTLGVYEVDPKHVRIGGIQCVFKRERATLIRRFPLIKN